MDSLSSFSVEGDSLTEQRVVLAAPKIVVSLVPLLGISPAASCVLLMNISDSDDKHANSVDVIDTERDSFPAADPPSFCCRFLLSLIGPFGGRRALSW